MYIRKSGAIILNKLHDSVLLLFRDNRKDWSFPKGHIEEGEDDLAAMVRETKEETGLDIMVVKKMPNVEYVTTSGENVIIYFYLVKSLDDTLLKLEHSGDILEWVKIPDVCNKLSYPNLKDYFENIKDFIKV